MAIDTDIVRPGPVDDLGRRVAAFTNDNLFTGVNELGEGESFIEKPFGADGLLEATRLLMFGHISDMPQTPDTRDDEDVWSDERFRAKLVRVLRKFGMA